jgi:hypothetical protein
VSDDGLTVLNLLPQNVNIGSFFYRCSEHRNCQTFRQIQLFLRDKPGRLGGEIKETVCHYTVLTANYINKFPYIWLRQLQPLEGATQLVRAQQFTAERLINP